MDTHLRVLGKSCPMNTNMTGFRQFSILALWTNVAAELEGLKKIVCFSAGICVILWLEWNMCKAVLPFHSVCFVTHLYN